MSGRLDPEPVARRDFLGIAGVWTAGITILGSILGMARLPKPRVLPEVSARFRIGKPSELILGASKIIKEHNVRVVRTDEGVAAVSLVCTHLGCIIKETPEGFACPCHGSVFDARGNVIAGPAPSPLRWLAVSQAANGSLIVDKDVQVPPGEFYRV